LRTNASTRALMDNDCPEEKALVFDEWELKNSPKTMKTISPHSKLFSFAEKA